MTGAKIKIQDLIILKNKTCDKKSKPMQFITQRYVCQSFEIYTTALGKDFNQKIKLRSSRHFCCFLGQRIYDAAKKSKLLSIKLFFY